MFKKLLLLALFKSQVLFPAFDQCRLHTFLVHTLKRLQVDEANIIAIVLIFIGEYGIVYKGCFVKNSPEVVAIKILKGV